MEAVLELLFTIAETIIDLIPFKTRKSRTWAMTALYLLLFVLVESVPIVGVVELYQQGSVAGTIVMVMFSAGIAIAAMVVLIRGHKRNWERPTHKQ